MRGLEKFKGFDNIKDTIFLKDFNRENTNLKKLEQILLTVSNNDIKKQIEKEISLIKLGLEGENNVYFELKNSFLPMICMHDIRIQVGELFAQIDFLVLTNKFFYVFETKHLAGDVRINKEGDFIRVMNDEMGVRKEEGMYNPVTQGDRHSRILRKFLEVNNILNIDDFPIKSIAVLANPKTIIDKEEAPIHIKDNIYRCDQVVHFLQREFSNPEYNIMISDSKIQSIGSQILQSNVPLDYDYEYKYGLKNTGSDKLAVKDFSSNTNHTNTNADTIILDYDDSKKKMEEEIRKLRKRKSKELGIEAYKLFKNEQLDLLIKYRPKTLVELNKLNIISKNSSYHVGKEIVDIINKYSMDFNTNVKKVVDGFSNEKEVLLRVNLEKYRREKSENLLISEYKIFTNNQLEDIIKTLPANLSDLENISGFNDSHVKNFGEDIINIVNNQRKSLYTN